MKTFFSLLLCLLCLSATAQTQQGIVKTRGRMVNGQLVTGNRLPGATITLSLGNPQVSGNQGQFSFNVPASKEYSLVSASLKGYTLADPEYTRRTFSYSASNPFYVVLEDENQRQADINAATRKVRKTLTVQLEKREEEIEALKAQNKLTEKEYQQRLQQLYDNQSKSEQLVKEMAERYASTDYDQLDEFNRQVQMYIEEGELQKADSMIRSKGNMEQRVAEYKATVAANQKVREELEQSEQGAAKTYEDLSQDLYRRHTIYLQQLEQDSALYCLKLRADMDTTNMGAIWEYAELCHQQKRFKESQRYYHICLRLYTDDKNKKGIAAIQNNLGILYSDIHDYKSSEKYLKQALVNYEYLLEVDPCAYRANLAATQNNLGNLYSDLHDYISSEKYLKQALENRELLFTSNPDIYREDLAMTKNNLGLLYYSLHDYVTSEKYYKLALENTEQLFAGNPDAYRANLVTILNNLGTLYSDLHDHISSEKYYKKALENVKQSFVANQEAYREELAKTLDNLASLYIDIHDYSSAENYCKLALENIEQLFVSNPDAYREILASIQDNLGILYANLQDYTSSEKYFKLALKNIEQLFSDNPEVYRGKMAMTCNNLMLLSALIDNMGQYDKYLKKASELCSSLYLSNPNAYKERIIELQNRNIERMLMKGDTDEALELAKNNYALDESNKVSKEWLADCYFAKSFSYAQQLDLAQAHLYVDQALALLPTNVNYYEFKGVIYLIQDKNEEALKIWNKVLELNPDFLKDNPEGSNLFNGLKKRGLLE